LRARDRTLPQPKPVPPENPWQLTFSVTTPMPLLTYTYPYKTHAYGVSEIAQARASLINIQHFNAP